jgi:CMP/dCMP kinase
VSAVVAISGDLGSGKSTISRLVAEELGFRRIGTGDVQRQIAEELGMSTLELNRYSEDRAEFDARIDAILAEFANAAEPIVADSRLAWFLLPGSFKVHLVVEPNVGAERVVERGSRTVESYASSNEALAHIRERRESERRRFLKWHGVDIARLRNYDLLIDTTEAPAETVAHEIVSEYKAGLSGNTHPHPQLLLLSPRRIYPTENPRVLATAGATATFEQIARNGFDRSAPISVGYVRPFFYVVDGHRRLSAALRVGLQLVPSTLAAEQDEPVVGDISSRDFLRGETRRSWLHDWEDAHGFRFADYPFESATAQL